MLGKLTFLGTGTSQGVPVITCECDVCISTDNKDKRLRTSALIEVGDKTILIDSGPDFRQQMLREKVKSLDAILFTHEHKDHIAGTDDVRAFNHRQQRTMEVFCTLPVEHALKREFHYAFEPVDKRYPGVPSININSIKNYPFEVSGVEITPIEVWHHKMPVLGYRIGNMAYITDANRIENEELKKLEGLDVLVLNSLRKSYHISHFTLDEAVALAKKLKPKMTYLTHISHLLGKHNEVNAALPENIKLAFDGLKVDFS
ncbi:MAG: MBL fold metallo-hydrolase [Flavobacteriales bacterium]